MPTTMTSKGQVTVPKPVRDYLGLHSGSAIEFEIDTGGAVIVRAAEPAQSRTRRSRASELRGTLNAGRSTEELMNFLRDCQADVRDPGFGGT